MKFFSRLFGLLNASTGVGLAGIAVGMTVSYQYFSTQDVTLTDFQAIQKSVQEANQQMEAITQTIETEEIRRIVLDVVTSQDSPETVQETLSAAFDNAMLQKVQSLESKMNELGRSTAQTEQKATVALRDPEVQEAIDKISKFDPSQLEALDELAKVDELFQRVEQVESVVDAIKEIEEVAEIIEENPEATAEEIVEAAKDLNLNDKKLLELIEKVERLQELEGLESDVRTALALESRIKLLESNTSILTNELDELNPSEIVDQVSVHVVLDSLRFATTDLLQEGESNIYFTEQRTRDVIETYTGALVADITSIEDNAESGYVDIESMRIQWGKQAVSNTTITLPARFANASYSVTATNHAGGLNSHIYIDSITPTTFRALAVDANASTVIAGQASWQAIGLKPE